jgi:hypothetical protein
MIGTRTMRALLTVFAALAALGCLTASSAMAEPTGEFAIFKECPITHSPRISGCLVSKVEKGYITIGKQEVPIVNTQTLQGGFINHEGLGVPETFVGALKGNTLSKTSQKVPGGLAGLVECDKITGGGFWEVIERGSCEFFFENTITGVNATPELSSPASSIVLNEDLIFAEEGTGLELPLKVKLENPLLGEECYIGPISLALTTGTSGKVKGAVGTIGSRGPFSEILQIKNNSLVSNEFTAPKATGCGEFFSFLIDPIINAKIGLPAGKGQNTAVLTGTVEQTSRASVEENEEEG